MTEKQVLEIRTLWAQPIPYRKAWECWKKQCPSERCFQKIWRRETWQDVGKNLITDELIQWHQTKGKSLSRDEVHNSALTINEIELIKKEKDNYEKAADYYNTHPEIQKRMTRDSFGRIWRENIR